MPGLIHQISPPATVIAVPVTAAASAEHRYSTAAATSCGLISRAIGMSFTYCAMISSSDFPVFFDTDGDGFAHEIGVGIAGADRIHGHAGFGGFDRQRAHEADDRMLGGAIGRHIRIALQSGGRGDGDDTSEFTGDHVAHHRLRAVDGAHDVQIEHALELIGDRSWRTARWRPRRHWRPGYRTARAPKPPL